MATFGFPVGVGTTISSTEIENDSIVNADINSAAAIVDTKLDTIATAGKVSGAALTLLPNIPAGAGLIPVANLPSVPIYKVGTFQRAADAASNAQTIAHGLGVAPKFVRLTAMVVTASGVVAGDALSFGAYNGTTNSSVSRYFPGDAGNTYEVSNTYAIKIIWDQAGRSQTGVVTYDATNITITWTKAGSGGPSDNINVLWEAIA